MASGQSRSIILQSIIYAIRRKQERELVLIHDDEGSRKLSSLRFDTHGYERLSANVFIDRLSKLKDEYLVQTLILLAEQEVIVERSLGIHHFHLKP